MAKRKPPEEDEDLPVYSFLLNLLFSVANDGDEGPEA
jgi:hypothetical protein